MKEKDFSCEAFKAGWDAARKALKGCEVKEDTLTFRECKKVVYIVHYLVCSDDRCYRNSDYYKKHYKGEETAFIKTRLFKTKDALLSWKKKQPVCPYFVMRVTYDKFLGAYLCGLREWQDKKGLMLEL